MTEPPDLRELIGGDDLPPHELARLEDVDAILRSVPAPPAEVPESLRRAITAQARRAPSWSRRRLLLAAALAAATAALFFGIGLWAGGDDFESVRTVELSATEAAAGASGLIRLGPRDVGSGNWEFELEVSGLEPLPEGGYYAIWLARGGEWAATCGTFSVGAGTTTVHLNASYTLSEFDDWVVTAWLPDDDPAASPWLLTAPTT